MASVMAFPTMSCMKVSAIQNDKYTVFSNDGYYSKTTYFYNENDYEQYVSEKNKAPVGKNIEKTKNEYNLLSMQTTNNQEFILGITKDVWVAEKLNDDGIITESRLLNKEEVDKFYTESNVDSLPNGPRTNTLSSGATLELTGNDSSEMYLLSISMSVIYDTGKQIYSIYGHASWEDKLVWLTETYRAAEETYLDYLGITWGGEGLKAESNSISGKYYDDDETYDFAKCMSESYQGFVWQFHEKEGYLGDELQYVDARVSLSRYTEFQGKETSVKLTYIHTYGKIENSVSFSVDSEGKLGMSTNLSESEKQWKIEIDVPSLKY